MKSNIMYRTFGSVQRFIFFNLTILVMTPDLGWRIRCAPWTKRLVRNPKTMHSSTWKFLLSFIGSPHHRKTTDVHVHYRNYHDFWSITLWRVIFDGLSDCWINEPPGDRTSWSSELIYRRTIRSSDYRNSLESNMQIKFGDIAIWLCIVWN